MGVRGGNCISGSGKWMSKPINVYQGVVNGCMRWQRDDTLWLMDFRKCLTDVRVSKLI